LSLQRPEAGLRVLTTGCRLRVDCTRRPGREQGAGKQGGRLPARVSVDHARQMRDRVIQRFGVRATHLENTPRLSATQISKLACAAQAAAKRRIEAVLVPGACNCA